MQIKMMVSAVFLVCSSSIVYAGCVGSVVSGRCMGTEVNGYGDDNQEDAYQGASGTHYQYDMSDPSDKIEYSVDIDAQMRDEISVNPSRNIDRSLGEYGGGIYDN